MMVLEYTYYTREELKKPSITPGEVSFEITGAEEGLNKNNNNQHIKLTLKLRDKLGNNGFCSDWLDAGHDDASRKAATRRLASLLDAADMSSKFKESDMRFSANDFIGFKGQCVVDNVEKDGKYFTNLKRYIVSQHKQPAGEPFTDSDFGDVAF